MNIHQYYLEEDGHNYKGYFLENGEDENEIQFFEYGAHFPYKELYNILEGIKKRQLKIQISKNIDKIFSSNKNKNIIKKKNNTRNKRYQKIISSNSINKTLKNRDRSRCIIKLGQSELTFISNNNNKNTLSFTKEKYSSSVFNNKSYSGKINYLNKYKSNIYNIKQNQNRKRKLSKKYLLTKIDPNNSLYHNVKLLSKCMKKSKLDNNKNKKYSNNLSIQKSPDTLVYKRKLDKKNINIDSLMTKFKNSYQKERFKISKFNHNNILTKKNNLTNIKLNEIKLRKSNCCNKLINNNKLQVSEAHFNTLNNSKEKDINHKKNILKKINNKKPKFLSKKNNIFIKINENIDDSKENTYYNDLILSSIENNGIKMNNINNTIIVEKSKLENLKIKCINTKWIKDKKIQKKTNQKQIRENSNISFYNSDKKNSKKKIDILKKISLFKISDNKTLSNKNLSNINKTQQNIKCSKNLSSKIKILESNNKHILSSYSKAKNKISPYSQLYNGNNSNKYYYKGFVAIQNLFRKISDTYMNASFRRLSPKIINLKKKKTNIRLNKDFLFKNSIKRGILINNTDESKISKSKQSLKRHIKKSEYSKEKNKNNISGSFMRMKTIQSLINNNEKNISININISNNNSNIVYNNNINRKDKNNLSVNTQKSKDSLESKKTPVLKSNFKSPNKDKKVKDYIKIFFAQKKVVKKLNKN